MNLMSMMKQAKEMQAKIKKLQDELAQRTVESSSGGGAIKVTVNGQMQVVKVSLDPELLKAGDASMLEDLILTAVNQAIQLISMRPRHANFNVGNRLLDEE